MNTLLFLLAGILGIRILGYKLLKEAVFNHRIKYTMRISENQQSDTSSNLLKYKIQGYLFKNLRLTGLFNWIFSLKTYLKKYIKEDLGFLVLENLPVFKNYGFDKAVCGSGTFHIVHSKLSPLAVINSNKKLRNIILTIFHRAYHNLPEKNIFLPQRKYRPNIWHFKI